MIQRNAVYHWQQCLHHLHQLAGDTSRTNKAIHWLQRFPLYVNDSAILEHVKLSDRIMEVVTSIFPPAVNPKYKR